MLVAEVIIFWTTFIIMSFPQIFMRFISLEKLEVAWRGEENDDEEEEEKNKEEPGNAVSDN